MQIHTYLQLLQREVCRGLIITHIVVPCLGELQKLGLLRRLNILQLLLLGCSDVVPLPLSLLLEQLVELAARFARFSIVTLLFALSTVLLKEAQEIQHLAISRHINHAPRAHVSHHLLRLHRLVRAHAHSSICHVVRVPGAVLDDFIFDLLHEVEELLEGDFAIRVGVQFVDELSHFSCIPLQTAHNRLQVFHLDRTGAIWIKHFKDGAQVLNLVIREVVIVQSTVPRHPIVRLSALHWVATGLLRHVIVGVVDADYRLLARHGLGSREWRPRMQHGFVLFGSLRLGLVLAGSRATVGVLSLVLILLVLLLNVVVNLFVNQTRNDGVRF